MLHARRFDCCVCSRCRLHVQQGQRSLRRLVSWRNTGPKDCQPPSPSFLLFSSPPNMLIITLPLSFCYRAHFLFLLAILIPCYPFTAETNCYASKRLIVAFRMLQALCRQATGKSWWWVPRRARSRPDAPSSAFICRQPSINYF